MPILDLALRLDLELRTAMRLVQEAGSAVLEISREDGGWEATQKADQTPVTRADLESDRLIREGLARQFPEDAVVSEETDEVTEGTSGRIWVVDPLDGTKAFMAGGDDYAIQLGLLDEAGKPILGCVYEPVTRRLYHAIAGVGAFMSVGGGGTIRQLRVSRRSTRSDMPLLTSSSMSSQARSRMVESLGCKDGGTARSVGYKVGKMVRREADVYYSGHVVSVWDTCAPLVVLEAAGGVMTGMDGAPLSFDVANGQRQHNGSFVASNAQDHTALVAAIAALAAPEG